MGALDEYIGEYVKERIEQSGDAHFTCRDAEENILRRMLRAQDVAEDAAYALSGKDFSNLDYGRIFCAIQDVLRHDMQVDAITVEDAIDRLFPKNGKRLRETMVVLTKYREYNVDDSHGIADHIKIVKDLAVRRNAIASIEGLVKQMYDPKQDISETLTAVQEAVTSTEQGARWKSMQDVLLATYDYMERRQKGEIKAITSGIGGIDRIIGGFYGGELTVIGARPSVGKSAFGVNIALAAANAGHKVGIVSCEMVDIGFGQRLLSHGAWVDGMKLRKGDINEDAWGKLAEAMDELGSLPIEFMFDSNYVEDVVQDTMRKVRRGELDMLIVDYLQLMESHKRFDADHLRVGYISKQLKRLAVQAGIPVIALAQVSRETDGSMPTLRHLKDSGSIEQDCDGVIFLHRPSSRDDPSIDERDRPYFEGYAERGVVYLSIGIAKQRNGAIGRVCVAFDPSIMRYIEIARDTE